MYTATIICTRRANMLNLLRMMWYGKERRGEERRGEERRGDGGMSFGGMDTRALVPGSSSGVRGYSCRGTRVFVTGYEVISAGVRGDSCRGTRVLVPGYEDIRSGVQGY